MNVQDLPAEIVQYIASFLAADSLSSLSQTCKFFNEITKIDSLWQVLSFQDFHIKSRKGWNLSYQVIYTKVLHKLRGILGLKRLALKPYGGLVHVCWGEGEIRVDRYLSPPNSTIYTRLLRQQLFSLRWNDSKQEIEVFCVQCLLGLKPAILAQAGKYPLLQCADADCHIGHTLKELRLGQSDRRFQNGFSDVPDAFSTFSLSQGFNCPLLPLQIAPVSDQTRSPIQLGLYAGDYGSHGVEILNFSFNQTDPYLLEGLKIVGDPNVPAGNVSVLVYLDKPIVLSEAEQESILDLLRAEETRSPDRYAALLHENSNNPNVFQQPFRIPLDCYDRGHESPDVCLARYVGKGRVAEHLYINPNYCTCHFIKFSDNKFGIMWLQLSSFSMFYKLPDDYDQPS